VGAGAQIRFQERQVGARQTVGGNGCIKEIQYCQIVVQIKSTIVKYVFTLFL
jgi:hypothetical protein